MRPRLAISVVVTVGVLALCAGVLALGIVITRAYAGPPRPSPPDEPRYCTLRYSIDDGRVPVCASLPLDDDALARLEAQLHEVSALYPRFATACGVALDGTPDALTLHVVRYDELNDRAAFPRDERVGNILGRYYVGRSAVFVTERALDEGGAIHLPHELAHWLQDHAGVSDPDEDERLARAFHRLYRSRASGRRPVLAERAVTRRFAADVPPLLARVDDEGATFDRSLVERTEAHAPSPLIDDLCGR